MDWGRKNLKDKHGDLFFVGSGIGDDDIEIGYDFAILSNCNASVISRGTFSMWSSVLAGGEYYTEYGMLYPDHILHPEDYQNEYYL